MKANNKPYYVFTRSSERSPSSYYRILQFCPEISRPAKLCFVVPEKVYKNYNNARYGLKRRFWQAMFYLCAYVRLFAYLLSARIHKPDTIFVSRAMAPKILLFPLAPLMKSVFKRTEHLIWDIDDHIFNSGEITAKERELLLEYTEKIIVIGDFLASLIPEEFHEKLVYLPTTDGDYRNMDLDDYAQARKARFEKEICLLWLATYTSLPFLEDIVPALDMAAKTIAEKQKKPLILEVVCNRPLVAKTEYLRIENITWTKAVARERMRLAHIGVMPLRKEEGTKGKGGFKMIQYMSAGLPTICSAVGYNFYVMQDGETGRMCYDEENKSCWMDAVLNTCDSWQTIAQMGSAARSRWDRMFSYDANLSKLRELLQGE